MKKLISLALIALMLLPAALAEEADLTGEWFASMQGIQAILTLNADGTCSLAIRGSADDAVWERDGDKIYVEHGAESKLIMTYDGENLVMSDDPTDPMAMVFRRELKEISLEDFQGDWKATLVNMLGLPVNAEEAGMDIVIRVEGETVTFLSGAEDEENRVLHGLYSDDEITASTSTANYVISYLENGTLQLREILSEDQQILMYMEPLAGEAADIEEVEDAEAAE